MIRPDAPSDTSPAPPDPVALLAERAAADRLALPVLPAVATEVLASVDGDDCDARSLAALVQRDPSLAAHVLRISNSARYAPREPIVSLTQAIGRLGLTNLREIVVGVAVKGAVFDVPGHDDYVRRLWLHAHTTARLAQEIARARRTNVEAAFLAGLLHDIGAPVALQGLVDACAEMGAQLDEARIVGAVDAVHTEVGARLAEHWKLPTWVRDSILHHHAPEAAGAAQDVVRTVALADALAEWLVEDEGSGLPPGLEHAEALELYEEDLAAVCQRGPGILAEAAA